MPVSAKRRASNAKQSQKHREKQRVTKALRGKVAEDIINDVKVLVTRNKAGNLIITFDMSPETEAVLELYCQNKGFTLGDYQQDLVAEVMAKHGMSGEVVNQWTTSSDKKRQVKEDKENDLVREFVEAIGYGRSTFSLVHEEHPDAGHEGEKVIRMEIVYPDDTARLNVLRVAEAHGLEVWELEDRVMTQGLKNFTGKDREIIE